MAYLDYIAAAIGLGMMLRLILDFCAGLWGFIWEALDAVVGSSKSPLQ